MTWPDLGTFSLGIVVALGGGTGIAVSIIKMCAGQIIEGLSKKYEFQLSKELEEFKNRLEKKSHVGKAWFDAKFAVIKEISREFQIAADLIENSSPSGEEAITIDCEIIGRQVQKIKQLIYGEGILLPMPIIDDIKAAVELLNIQLCRLDPSSENSEAPKTREVMHEERVALIRKLHSYLASFEPE